MSPNKRYVQLVLDEGLHGMIVRAAQDKRLPVASYIRLVLLDKMQPLIEEQRREQERLRQEQDRQQAPVTGKGKPGPAAKPKWVRDAGISATRYHGPIMRHAPPDIAAWESFFVADTGRLSTWPPEVPDITVFVAGNSSIPESYQHDAPCWYFMKNSVRVTVPSRYHLPDNGDWLCFRSLKDVEPYYDSVIRPAIREMYDGMNDAAQ